MKKLPPDSGGLAACPEYLDLAGVAGLISISKRTAAQLLARGELPHVRFSKRCIRFPRKAVLDALAARTIGMK